MAVEAARNIGESIARNGFCRFKDFKHFDVIRHVHEGRTELKNTWTLNYLMIDVSQNSETRQQIHVEIACMC